jgi:hypothetical protein
MADTDIQLADTDISISVLAKYIGKPIYRSNPRIYSDYGHPSNSVFAKNCVNVLGGALRAPTLFRVKVGLK